MEKKWYVASCNGDLAGHDMSEANAKILAAKMAEEEPDMEWEALNADSENGKP